MSFAERGSLVSRSEHQPVSKKDLALVQSTLHTVSINEIIDETEYRVGVLNKKNMVDCCWVYLWLFLVQTEPFVPTFILLSDRQERTKKKVFIKHRSEKKKQPYNFSYRKWGKNRRIYFISKVSTTTISRIKFATKEIFQLKFQTDFYIIYDSEYETGAVWSLRSLVNSCITYTGHLQNLGNSIIITTDQTAFILKLTSWKKECIGGQLKSIPRLRETAPQDSKLNSDATSSEKSSNRPEHVSYTAEI